MLRRTLAGQKVDPTSNQAAWLANEYAKAKQQGRTVMFAQHHPLFTCGKRSYKNDWDADLYLSHEEIKMINRILELIPGTPDFYDKLKKIFDGLDEEVSKKETNGNYNSMLTKIYQLFQHMYPDVVFAAHDHSIYYYNNISLTDLVLMFLPPEKDKLDALPVASNAAYVRCGTQLFYINKTTKECIEIKISLKDLASFDEKMRPNLKPKALKKEELETITAITGHTSYTPGNANPGYNLCQVISGGGGGELMDRRYFSENKNLGCFFNNNGFFFISCDKNNPDIINIEPYTTYGNHLKFTNMATLALRGEEIDPRVSLIREKILEACNSYLNFLDDMQKYYDGSFFSKFKNLTHSSRDVDHMHQIEAYLYEPVPADFDTTIINLYRLASQLYNKASEHSLYKGINDRLKLIPELKSRGLDELYNEILLKELKPASPVPR
jgi:hypothetical protein